MQSLEECASGVNTPAFLKVPAVFSLSSLKLVILFLNGGVGHSKVARLQTEVSCFGGSFRLATLSKLQDTGGKSTNQLV